jgi:choline dehydrogenase-like flavoprotein
MIVDARTFSANQIFEADLCIVGAGAAGIAMAREFVNSDAKVIVLESGGLGFDHRTQFLYRGEVAGRNFTPLEFTRRRQFGGSTSTWFGRCRPLEDSDFEKRDWLPYSGWPISAADLRPYYEKANRLFELNDYADDKRSEVPQGIVDFKKFAFSPPTHFGEKYHNELSRSSNLHVFLYANAVHVQLAQDSGRVDKIRCSTLQKKSFSVRAKVFVLALGGLETTRLLLASRDVQRYGIGNQFDLLGRFFMDHVSLFDGAVVQIDGDFPKELFKLDYSIQQKNLGSVLAVGLTEKYKNEHKLLNACGFFVKRSAYKMDDLFFSKEMRDLVYLSDMACHAIPPTVTVVKNLTRAIYNSRKLAPALKKRFLQNSKSPTYGLQLQLECAPNPESRLTLSDQRDSLGMPRLRLNWRLSQQDLDSYLHFRSALFNGLAEMGPKIRLVKHDLDAEGWPVSIVSSKHHMGTTRMSQDVKMGVVDENCCVHGIHNLYVASSSTFPTSGMANPTLTIAALALRIADRVKQRLQG